MESLFTLIGTIVVAILSFLGVLLQTKSKEKQNTIESKLDLLREESKSADAELKRTMDNNHMQTLKLWLVTEMTKIRDGAYIPNEEQKHLVHEAKRDYNLHGGDSYVDDMFEDLRSKKLI